MGIIGQIRSLFHVSVPVFTLMAETFGDFASAVIEAADEQTEGRGEVTSSNTSTDRKALLVRGGGLDVEETSPSFVFFPMAGGSPRQFAQTYLAIAKQQPNATIYLVAPAGREERASEPHASSMHEFCAPVVSALKEHLAELSNGPCCFVGDSVGALTALTVAHQLHTEAGFCPTHMVFSGSESPGVVSTQKGLGSYSNTPLAELSDDDLIDFLVASGAERSEVTQDVVEAFRADCLLYEDYTKVSGWGR